MIIDARSLRIAVNSTLKELGFYKDGPIPLSEFLRFFIRNLGETETRDEIDDLKSKREKTSFQNSLLRLLQTCLNKRLLVSFRP